MTKRGTTNRGTTGRRIGLYGASFDPPHIAHVFTVAWGLSACPLDEVWLVPVWRHAFGKDLTPYDDRVALCERAFGLFGDRVRISHVERALGTREGATENRTIDTVKHLIATDPDHRFALLMGTDLFQERHRWKAFDELERLVTMHVVGRGGVPDPPDQLVGPHLPPVSSTDIRARFARGANVDGLVPRAVAAYVREKGLYGA